MPVPMSAIVPVVTREPEVLPAQPDAERSLLGALLIDGGLLLQPRWGLPEDVGRAVAVLARGDLTYSTGQVLMVDGGFSVQRL